MNNSSWRHHYLPVFYLKGFTNSTDKFLIFDKEQNDFIKNGKEFSPSSYFFEKHANSYIKNGEKDDFMETKFFKKFDDRIAKMFELIRSSNSDNRFSVSEKDMPLLQNFVNLMYWRLPHRKQDLEDFLQDEDLKGFGLFVENEDGSIDEKTKETEEQLKNDPEFKKGLGFLMSLVDTVKMIGCNTPLSIIPFVEGLPYVCSDNPVLFEKEIKPKVYEDDFVFPISGNMIFIRANRTSKLNLTFKLMVDTLIFKQAVKYVSFSDKRYLDSLNEFYEKHFKSTVELRSAIFNFLKEKNT